MRDIHFHKMHGCGNDFIFIDNREAKVSVPEMAAWAELLCRRKTGIGADGLLFLDTTPEGREGDFIWHFYNADGSRAEMCGNASRCASWLAVNLGLAGRSMCFGTDAGLIHADVDVEHLGRLFRYHEHFAPRGTNVNFITVIGRDAIHVRTYERGVEGETLACGTGAAASTCIAHALGLTDCSVNVTTSGKELLGIELAGDSVFLSGAVARVFTGVIDPSQFSLLKF